MNAIKEFRRENSFTTTTTTDRARYYIKTEGKLCSLLALKLLLSLVMKPLHANTSSEKTKDSKGILYIQALDFLFVCPGAILQASEGKLDSESRSSSLNRF